MNINLLDHIEDLPSYVATLSLDEKKTVLSYLKQVEEYKNNNKLLFFKPDTWQKDAIARGATEKFRAIIAGNRLGKSYTGTYELSVHLTGKYPSDWEGMVIQHGRGINTVALGVDFTQIAKPMAMQELLLGPVGARGTGFIPKDDIVRMVPKMGVRDVVATVYVKHYNEFGQYDGDSRLDFGSYNQGDEPLQGAAYDFFLIDESPSDDTIFEQCKKRTWSVDGAGLCVMTPERGMTNTISNFWEEDGIHHGGLIHVTLWDSSLYTEEEKIRMNESIAPWQRIFSIEGIPSAGTGAVFSGILKETLLDNSFEIKPHWKRMSAVDLGYKDDMVFSFMALDPDTGTYYMYDELVYTETDAIICARGARPLQQGFIPMILPADGDSERGLGATYHSLFKDAGLIVLDEQARNWYYDDTGKDRSIKAGIIYMRELMLAGKLKVHPKCSGFLKEFGLYSYDKNGKFIDKFNHSIDSWRYCLMAIDKFGVSEYKHNNKDTGNYDRYFQESLEENDIY